MKVAVVGLGHVGTVTAACMAAKGHDPIVNPARLVGANCRYIESKLPHLGRLLAQDPGEALRGADVAIISADGRAVLDALLRTPPPRLIDLNGRLGSEVESLRGYEGVGW